MTSLEDKLVYIESLAYCVRNAVNAGMKEDALYNIAGVISTCREGLSQIAHDRDIAETRQQGTAGVGG